MQILQEYYPALENKIGKCNTYEHKLQMKDQVPYMNPKDRPIPHVRIPIIESTIQEWLKDDIVSPERSPYITPIHIVTKENGYLFGSLKMYQKE